MNRIIDAIPDIKTGKVKWLTPEDLELIPVGIPKIMAKRLLSLATKDGLRLEASTERGKKILEVRAIRTYLLISVEMLLERREGEE